MPRLCVCGARGRFGGVWAGAGCCVFPVSPCPPRVSCALCGGPSRLGVPYPRSLVRHSVRFVRSAGSVWLHFWFSPCVLCVCVRSRSRGVRAPPPPARVGVARAPRAVPVLGAGRAVLLGPCPSACPASVPCSVWLAGGGAARSRFPLPGLGLRAPRGLGAGVGTRHQPHCARSCELPCALAWRAVGAARERPGGAPLALVRSVRGWALSHPRPLVLSGVRPGPTTHWLLVRGVRAWGPVTNPTARALASWLCALWGRPEGARGGASCLGVGRPGLGALPPPTTRPFGRAAGAHYPVAVGAVGAGVGTRQQPHSARSCEPALRAVRAARERPGGAPLAWVRSVRGWALSDPQPLVLSGVRPGPTTP